MDESSERTIERLRPMIPDIDQLWDRSLPLTANLSQLSQRAGGRAVSRNEHDDLPGQHVRPAAPKQSSLEEATSDALRRQILCDLQLQPIAPKSPLCELQEQVQRFFQFGPLHAGGVFNEMSHAADRGTTVVDIPDMDVSPPWNSCKAAATLVALFACQADRLKEVRRSQRRLFGDMPTLEDIRKTPNTSLQDAFQKAKSQARNDSGHTTVLAVTLTNVHIFELAEQGRSEGYTSYAHVFVMGIGPEGVIIWQGWGAQGHEGYGLDQWLEKDGARMRTWQEAEEFVDRFEKFATRKSKWDAKQNKLYKQCFDMDLIQACGPKGGARPIVRKAESWVRMLVFDDVKVEDIYRFKTSPPVTRQGHWTDRLSRISSQGNNGRGSV